MAKQSPTAPLWDSWPQGTAQAPPCPHPSPLSWGALGCRWCNGSLYPWVAVWRGPWCLSWEAGAQTQLLRLEGTSEDVSRGRKQGGPSAARTLQCSDRTAAAMETAVEHCPATLARAARPLQVPSLPWALSMGTWVDRVGEAGYSLPATVPGSPSGCDGMLALLGGTLRARQGWRGQRSAGGGCLVPFPDNPSSHAARGSMLLGLPQT